MSDTPSRTELSDLDRLTSAFEDAWQQGLRPALEAHLPAAGVEQHQALVELVHLDLEYRLKAGEPARVEEYLERYPQLARERTVLLGLITAEARQRRRREVVAAREYQARFPQMCDDLATWTDPAVLQWAGVAGGRLGKYELLEVAGRGAWSVVYRARDTELGREVAVKVPRLGGLMTTAETDRFLREARSAARLRHPHIVPLYDAGSLHDTCFLVSAFVAGSTLADRLREGLVPLRQGLELLIQVAEAIQHAHEHGIIHRDLKPSNILLDETGRAQVLDFGLARQEGGEATLTQEGEVLGTPAYMSPEQARGEAHQADARSDVYSLGVILYEVLTGERPFGGSPRMTLRQVLEDEPRPPRRLNDEVPRDVETICLKALSKEPDGRYPSAAAFAGDLHRFLRGQPVQARPVGAAGKVWRWCRLRPALAALLGILALVTALGLGGILWQWHRAEVHLAEVERQRDRARVSFRQAHGTLEDFLELGRQSYLGRTESLSVDETHQIKASHYYQEFLRQWGAEESLRPELAQAHLVLGRLQAATGTIPEAQANTWQALRLYEYLIHEHADYAPYQGGLAAAYYQLGLISTNADRTRETMGFYRHAQEILERLMENQSARNLSLACFWLRCNLELSRLYHLAGKVKEGRGVLDHSLERAEQFVVSLPSDGSESLAEFRYLLGHLYRQTRRRSEALASYQKAADLYEQVHRDRPNRVYGQYMLGRSCYFVGNLYRDLSQPAEALLHYRRALPLHEQVCQDRPNDLELRGNLGETWHNLGMVLARLGRHAEAVDAFQQAIGPQRFAFSRAPKETRYRRLLGDHYLHLAGALRELGKPAEFAAALEECYQVWQPEPGKLVLIAQAWARAAADAGSTEPAREHAVGRAVALVRLATAHGFRDGVRLRSEPDLLPLRSRADFQAILKTLPVAEAGTQTH